MIHISLGKWSETELDGLIHESRRIVTAGERIAFISEKFLGVHYEESTLIGGVSAPETLVINFSGVDCFTLIDYVEAMRISGSFPEFIENLKGVRYRQKDITFENRKHFFSDWIEWNQDLVEDVTGLVGGLKTKKALKILNEKEKGAYLIQGIKPRQRKISYIPAETINDSIVNHLKTGDYAGIYSHLPGLDVSHVGIVIKSGASVLFRHASSQHGKVADQDLREYIADNPGLIVLRPR